MDLLEDAGIPPPRSPFDRRDRAALASLALAQRQFYYVSVFLSGWSAARRSRTSSATTTSFAPSVRWVLSGTGLALIAAALNTD